ncbi:MAG: MopE-related protein, partial [Acidobacteriota bacterium]
PASPVCGGSANFFEATGGQNPFQPLPAGTAVDLLWGFPGATYVFLPGVGELPATGSHRVWPTATTTYELFVRFGGAAETSFRVTVFVAGSAPLPLPGATCDRPCSEAVDVAGTLYYCRGIVLQDQGAAGGALDRQPHWLSVGDWRTVLRPGGVRPSYCYRATCGGGNWALNSWNTPDGLSYRWLPDSSVADLTEILGDGLDNDCDGVVDTGGDPSCKPPTFDGLQTVSVDAASCSALLSWAEGSSSCGNELRYNVYRTSHGGVTASPEFQIAADLETVSFEDTSAIAGAHYYWTVEAIDHATGEITSSGAVVGQQIACGASANTFTASAGTDPQQPVSPGQSVVLSWDFPGATRVFLPGVGDLGAAGERLVQASQTTTYELYVRFGIEEAAFRVTVHVAGSSAVTPFGECDRGCTDSVEIEGDTYYCRGAQLWDQGANGGALDTSPIWLRVADWAHLAQPGGSRPPYCYRASCGVGLALNAWNPPTVPPYIWIDDANLGANFSEIPGDGLDNDCDGVIDDGSGTGCSVPSFLGLDSLSVDTGSCSVDLAWDPAQSSCGNAVAYNIYRAAHSGVAARPDMRIAAGVGGSGYTDSAVTDGGSYYWLVTAVDLVTGEEVLNQRRSRIAVDCGSFGGGAAGDFFIASDGTDPSDPVLSGAEVELSWSFDGPPDVFLPGVGDLPPNHFYFAAPEETTTYELWVDYPGRGESAFRVTVYVEGSALPSPGEACTRSCVDAVFIDGVTYYCRGLELKDDGTYGSQYDREPHWMSVGDWAELLAPGGSRPPYCYKATCGGGVSAFAPWNTPLDLPETWITTEDLLQHRPEIPGDGVDNDCDRQIDEVN